MTLNIHLHSFLELRKGGVLPARSVTSARHRECPKGKLTHASKIKTDFTLFLSVGGKVVGQKKADCFSTSNFGVKNGPSIICTRLTLQRILYRTLLKEIAVGHTSWS